MTAPIPPSQSMYEAPSIVSSGIESLRDNASRLGLSWNLQLGSVESYNAATRLAYVILDGDTLPIAAKTMIGAVTQTQRVYVIFVPPGGYFVSGSLQDDVGFQVLGANICVAGVLANSTGTTEVAIPSANLAAEPIFNFLPGLLFQFTLETHVLASTAADSQTIVRVRQGAATIAGTQLGAQALSITSASAGTDVEGHTVVGYFANNTASVISTKLSITNQRVKGAATTSLFGTQSGNPLPIRLVISQVGLLRAPVGGFVGLIASLS